MFDISKDDLYRRKYMGRTYQSLQKTYEGSSLCYVSALWDFFKNGFALKDPPSVCLLLQCPSFLSKLITSVFC